MPNTDALKDFAIVMRGPSAVTFLQGDQIAVRNFPTSIGKVDIVYTTRWLKRSESMTVPGQLWIEVRGRAKSLDTALPACANAGLNMLPILSVGANAAIGEPEVEVAFDISRGAEAREYFQSYIPPENDILHNIRVIDSKANLTLIEVMASHKDGERLRRGANQYRLALDYWRLGRELLSLAHLWMALEAITKVKIRLECLARGCSEPSDLANQLGIELKELDSTIRREFLLDGDEECYKQAKAASDGFEHGYLGYDEIGALSKNVRHRMAGYVRKAILEMCGLDAATSGVLMNAPFDKPLGYWPITKYLRGHLVGKGDDLALTDNAYPFMRWKPVIKSVNLDATRKITVMLDETMTAELAEGISFQPRSLEIWEAG